MKSFTLISGILIILLGVFFFANPTSLLAIVGWIFALMMLISGGSSLMVYFKRDNENRSFFQLLNKSRRLTKQVALKNQTDVGDKLGSLG